jgi:Methylamine utilisation protein MauE
VAQALTAPLLVAAAVLCVAAVAKLRSPGAALDAFATLHMPASPLAVRAFAAAELAIGAWCAIAATPAATIAVACLYAGFAGAAAALARTQATCGCFGEAEHPASLWQSAISAVFAAVALTALTAGAHGVAWVLDRPALEAATILIGTAGAAYAAALAYTLLPQAWTAWSAP